MQTVMTKMTGALVKGKPAVAMLLSLCALIPLIISATFMGIYWYMASGVAEYNDYLSEKTTVESNYFDTCGILYTGIDLETGWSVVYNLNGAIYTILTLATILMILSAFFGPLAYVGAVLAMCTQCAHFAALIVTGVFRFSDGGADCADLYSIPVTLDKETSFKDVGDLMARIFIAQAVLVCFYGCCVASLAKLSLTTMVMSKNMATII